MGDAEYYAEVLAFGADEARSMQMARTLVIKRVHLPRLVTKRPTKRHPQERKVPLEWEPYRRTLSNHIERGAWLVIQKRNKSRIVWTTTNGSAQEATLQRWSGRPVLTIQSTDRDDLEGQLVEDIAEVLADAPEDRRARGVTARGFNVEQMITNRRKLKHFWEVAVGREEISHEEVAEFCWWWEEMLGVELRIEHRGLPLPEDVLRVVRETKWAGWFHVLEPGEINPEPDTLTVYEPVTEASEEGVR